MSLSCLVVPKPVLAHPQHCTFSLGLFTTGHFMRFLRSDSYLSVSRLYAVINAVIRERKREREMLKSMYNPKSKLYILYLLK